MSAYVLEFWLPGVPKPMNQVLRMHWAKRNDYYQALYVDVARKIAFRKPLKPLELVKLSFERHAYRMLDYDGCVASMKPIADGLVRAMVLKDDSWPITGKWDVDQTFRPKGQECVYVRVEERAGEL